MKKITSFCVEWLSHTVYNISSFEQQIFMVFNEWNTFRRILFHCYRHRQRNLSAMNTIPQWRAMQAKNIHEKVSHYQITSSMPWYIAAMLLFDLYFQPLQIIFAVELCCNHTIEGTMRRYVFVRVCIKSAYNSKFYAIVINLWMEWCAEGILQTR